MPRAISKMIPGDWGKAGPGWLARPLHERAVKLGIGGRIHQPLWRRSRAVSDARQGLGGEERSEKPLRVESSSSGEFRP